MSTPRAATKAFPQHVPMQHEYPLASYFVRDCYGFYYDVIAEWLLGEKYKRVTVMGTSGIGKSVFMAYFAERFSEANAYLTLILESYTPQCELLRVAVWEGGLRLVDCASGTTPDMIKTIARYQQPSTIFLLDGTPAKAPVGRWVCFTSPSDMWLATHQKDTLHRRVYMPLWTQEELRRAARALGLASLVRATKVTRQVSANAAQYLALEAAQVDAEDVVGARCSVFGGVARVCLCEDVEFVADAYAELVHVVENVKFEDVPRILKMKGRAMKDTDSVFHYHPLTPPIHFSGQVASEHVKQLLIQELILKRCHNRDELEAILHGRSEGSSVVG